MTSGFLSLIMKLLEQHTAVAPATRMVDKPTCAFVKLGDFDPWEQSRVNLYSLLPPVQSCVRFRDLLIDGL